MHYAKYALIVCSALYVSNVSCKARHAKRLPVQIKQIINTKAKISDEKSQKLEKIIEVKENYVDNTDRYRDACGIIESRGFLCETHYSCSSDGYYTAIHRIVNPLMRGVHGKPVILMHELLQSSVTWIVQNAFELLGE